MDSLMDFQKIKDSVYGDLSNDSDEPLPMQGLANKVDLDAALLDQIHSLVKQRLLIRKRINDKFVYGASDQLTLSKVVSLPDTRDRNILRNILLPFVHNPKGFFMLGNTQSGKTKQSIERVEIWSKVRGNVAFLVVKDDTALADQFVDRLREEIKRGLRVKLFQLSGTSKDKVEEIQDYLLKYASNYEDELMMPLVVLLSNEVQNTKMVNLLQRIRLWKKTRGCPLVASILWDECDLTYPRLRNRSVDGYRSLDGDSIQKFVLEEPETIHEVFWVSATDGSLLQSDADYPECLTAQRVQFIPDEYTREFYRAFHTTETVIHRNKCLKDLNENASHVIRTHLAHFMGTVQDRSGKEQRRKIIVNSCHTVEKMKELAAELVSMGMNVFVFNGEGGSASLTLYTSQDKTRYPLKGASLNQLLFYLYKKRGLESMPLVVLGNRKVDRGLTFHNCPRNDRPIPWKTFAKVCQLGDIVTTPREGLIFTDEILGRIEDLSTSDQKAGRAGGIIGDSPQYTGLTHYWTDDETADAILSHNLRIDSINEGPAESMRMIDMVSTAKCQPVPNHDTPEDCYLVYTDEATALAAAQIVKGPKVKWYKYKPKSIVNGFIVSSVGGTKKDKDGNKRPYTLIEAIHAVMSPATKDRVYFPCYRDLTDNQSIHYVVLTLKEGPYAVDPAKAEEARNRYPSVHVPQFGGF